MKREDWLEQLLETVAARRRMPFRWAGINGGQDCCTFAAACIEAMTGYDCSWFANEYRDERTATEYVASLGGFRKAVSWFLGAPDDDCKPRTGDIVLTLNKGREIVGVVLGWWVAIPGANGLVFQLRRRILSTWRL